MADHSDLSEQDIAAVLALISRYSRTQDENKALIAAKAEIDAKLVKGREQMQKLVSAFSVFGFDISSGSKTGFQPIRNAVGSEAYLEALHAGGREYGITSTRDEDSGVPEGESEPASDLSEEVASGSIRELALEQLKQAGMNGTTAAAIRKHIEALRSATLHYKTVGMTLYRLSQDGFARREGHTWFAVDKTTNPGGDTPGSNKSGT